VTFRVSKIATVDALSAKAISRLESVAKNSAEKSSEILYVESEVEITSSAPPYIEANELSRDRIESDRLGAMN